MSQARFGAMRLVLAVWLGWAASAQAAPFAYVATTDSNLNPVGNSVDVFDLGQLPLLQQGYAVDPHVTTIQVGGTANAGPWGVAVTPDGKRVLVTNRNENSVSVIDTVTNTVTKTISVGTDPYGVAVSTDGKRALITNRGGNTVSVIDTTTLTVSATIGGGSSGQFSAPAGVVIHPTNPYLAFVANGNGTLSFVNVASSAIYYTATTGRSGRSIAMMPDGSRMYVANEGEGTVSVVYTNGYVAPPISLSGYQGRLPQPRSLVVNAAGTKLYVLNWGQGAGASPNWVSVIDTATNAEVSTITGSSGQVCQYAVTIEVNPEESQLLFGSVNPFGNVPFCLFDMTTGQQYAMNGSGAGTGAAFGHFVGPANIPPLRGTYDAVAQACQKVLGAQGRAYKDTLVAYLQACFNDLITDFNSPANPSGYGTVYDTSLCWTWLDPDQPTSPAAAVRASAAANMMYCKLNNVSPASVGYPCVSTPPVSVGPGTPTPTPVPGTPTATPNWGGTPTGTPTPGIIDCMLKQAERKAQELINAQYGDHCKLITAAGLEQKYPVLCP